MSRTLTTAFVNAAKSAVVYPAILVEADFDSGSVNCWSGLGTLHVGGRDYIGTGEVLRIDPGEETSALEARGASFELTCAKDSDVSIALSEPYSDRPARIILALFDENATLISDPVRIFSGKMDVMSINDDTTRPIITLTAENDGIILTRVKERRFTHEDQQIDYAGDLFFEFVPSMQDREIQWG